METFLKNAMAASDLLASYGDVAIPKLEDLSTDEKAEFIGLLEQYEPEDACEAGAKAMLLFLLK